MPHPATPTEVFHALADGVGRLVDGDPSEADRLASLYAEETFVVHPLAPFGLDPLTSRADLRRHFAGGPGRLAGIERFEAVARVVHRTDDPEVVIAEFHYVGTAEGRPFDVPCIFVLRVRDGEIVESRDYADHLGFARVAGRLEQFCAALLTSAPPAPA
jgi:ketosteroid isomerase-like protein